MSTDATQYRPVVGPEGENSNCCCTITGIRDAISSLRKRGQQRVSTTDEHTMGPFEKFRRYGRFPCKVVLNVIIFSLICVLIFVFELKNSRSDENERKHLIDLFLDAAKVDDAVGPNEVGESYIVAPTIYLFKRKNVLDVLQKTGELYYDLVSNSLNDFDYLFNDHFTDFPHSVEQAAMRSGRTYGALGITRDTYENLRGTDGSSSYYDYVRKLFEDGKISKPTELNITWIEPPKMTLNMHQWSYRSDWRVSRNEEHTRTFFLTPRNFLGPFRELTDDNPPDADGVNSGEKGDSQKPNWLRYVCGPRNDHFFSGEMYFPCRERMDEETPDAALKARRLRVQQRVRRSLVAMATQRNKLKAGGKKSQRSNEAQSVLPPVTVSEEPPSEPFGLFDRVSSMVVSMDLQQVVKEANNKDPQDSEFFYKTAVYIWTIEMRFAMGTNGLVTLTVYAYSRVRRESISLHAIFAVTVLLFIFTIWDIALRIRAVRTIFRLRRLIRRRMEKHRRALLQRQRAIEEEQDALCGAAISGFFENKNPSVISNSGTGVGIGTTATNSTTFSPDDDDEESQTLLGREGPAKDSWLKKLTSSLTASKRGSTGEAKEPLLLNTHEGDIHQAANQGQNHNSSRHGSVKQQETKQKLQQLREEGDAFEKKWKRSLRSDMGMSWQVWALLSDAITLAYICFAIVESSSVTVSTSAIRIERVILGLAGLCSAVLLVSYLRYFPNRYFMIRATALAVPQILLFFIGVAPFFMAFSVFFVTVFGSYSQGQFQTLLASATALYCAVYGDNLLPIYTAVMNNDNYVIYALGGFMTSAFVWIFMWAVLNLSLAIVVNKYMGVREKYGILIGGDEKNAHQHLGKGILMARAADTVRRDAVQEIKRQLAIIDRTMVDAPPKPPRHAGKRGKDKKSRPTLIDRSPETDRVTLGMEVKGGGEREGGQEEKTSPPREESTPHLLVMSPSERVYDPEEQDEEVTRIGLFRSERNPTNDDDVHMSSPHPRSPSSSHGSQHSNSRFAARFGDAILDPDMDREVMGELEDEYEREHDESSSSSLSTPTASTQDNYAPPGKRRAESTGEQ